MKSCFCKEIAEFYHQNEMQNLHFRNFYYSFSSENVLLINATIFCGWVISNFKKQKLKSESAT
jgi:hypothetical protein